MELSAIFKHASDTHKSCGGPKHSLYLGRVFPMTGNYRINIKKLADREEKESEREEGKEEKQGEKTKTEEQEKG